MSSLAGKRVAIVGFDPEEGAPLLRAFEAAGTFCRAMPESSPNAGGSACDIAVVHLGRWNPCGREALPELVIAALTPDLLLARSSWVRSVCTDCVFWPCSGEELVFRAGWALERQQSARHCTPAGPFSVLVADDDPSVTALVKAVLESEGMVCRTAPDGVAALAAAREGTAGMAILDIHMPGMDGYQVLTALRNEGCTRSLPVILLTACDQEAEIVRGFGLGADDYVVKPFNPLEIYMRVKRIADRAGN